MRYWSGVWKAAWALSVLKCMTYRTHQKENSHLKFSRVRVRVFVSSLLCLDKNYEQSNTIERRRLVTMDLQRTYPEMTLFFPQSVCVIPGVDRGCPVRANSSTPSSGGSASLLASLRAISFWIWWLNTSFLSNSQKEAELMKVIACFLEPACWFIVLCQ